MPIMLLKESSEDESDTIVQAVLKTMSLTPPNHDDTSNSVAVEPPVEPRDPSEAEFSREENRLATFEPQDNNSIGGGWPPNAKMEPRKIAKAGLFYTGITRCLGLLVNFWGEFLGLNSGPTLAKKAQLKFSPDSS